MSQPARGGEGTARAAEAAKVGTAEDGHGWSTQPRRVGPLLTFPVSSVDLSLSAGDGNLQWRFDLLDGSDRFLGPSPESFTVCLPNESARGMNST